jgi:hypothetical protein
MSDMAARATPLLVAVLLALGLWRQFAASDRGWLLLDQLAIVPQWKFFGQKAIVSDAGCFDDLHLLARRANPAGAPGDWQELVWSDERRAIEAIWNPRARSRDTLLETLGHLVFASRGGTEPVPPTALSYLRLLRCCLDRLPLEQDGSLQFAIAATRGREGHAVALRFLSGWHTA